LLWRGPCYCPDRWLSALDSLPCSMRFVICCSSSSCLPASCGHNSRPDRRAHFRRPARRDSAGTSRRRKKSPSKHTGRKNLGTFTSNASTGEATANGHVVFEGGTHDEHIEASSATYNVKTESGQFRNVFGTTGLRFRGRNVQLTSANPFYFQGRLVEKIGRDRIIVHHGRVTSCEMPNPKWVFAVEKATVEPGNEARLYHSTFRVLGVPVFYLPYAAHPVNKIGRQTGFLI